MDKQAHDDAAAEIAHWLIGEARLTLDPVGLITGLCERLVLQGVSLSRVRAGQRLANPLASAWGILWTRDGSGTQEYLVPRSLLSTDAYHGSPFQYVLERRQSFRRRLVDLDPEADHQVLHDMAAEGGTDYLVIALEYGDGSVQGVSFVSDAADGFSDRQLLLIERLRDPLSAALEPTAMRRSTASLLHTFLGDGPADAVLAGAFQRGDRQHIEAAMLFADLRGFAILSERLKESDLFSALDCYFETVVEAVRGAGGDVLKFMGDGILAIFPVGAAGSEARACRAVLEAVAQAQERLTRATAFDGSPLTFVAALHVGQVSYGNIGSPERLDFTVLGPAVNLVSRLEGLAKQLNRTRLCSAAFARALDVGMTPIGRYPFKGFAEPQEVFSPGETLDEIRDRLRR